MMRHRTEWIANGLTFMLLTLLPGSTTGQTLAGTGPGHSEAAVRAIEQLVADYEKSWNHHDMAGWAALFTDDVDFVNRRGGWWITNEENLREHAAIHGMLAERQVVMDLEARVASVDFLAPEVALVHIATTWPGSAAPGEEGPPPGAIMTWVVRAVDGAWRIRSVQNTLVEPGAAGRAP